MRNFVKNKTSLALFLLATGLLAGCSHTVVVAPQPPDQIFVEKIPLDVGLYVSDDFMNHEVSEYKMGDQWKYTNLGMASATQFHLALRKAFQSVELVDGRPPFADGKDLTIHAVVEPAIERFDFGIPLTKFQVYPARIHYRVTVYDMDGQIITEDRVEGVGDTKGRPGFDFTENPSASATRSVEDGVRKAIEVLVNSREIEALKNKE